ncbi:UbiH/UbiF/VisC/COQ6 family ubiquinone biosynthesis hydroxylase [Kangiella sp. TOML190]|uniref:UbiH/UbiF/VisC/COQ6 family ubiquinone biosynthesis hydroxylase n=1 Tax=Kangiella sp. TOML190 TaxID=2931351 RepID=UPI00203AEBC4|nr:UbiH/UbiF/VisC/COQ6 family ubiquinone biosynthesis hydroxylase [Kangiella sp. TOML190]
MKHYDLIIVGGGMVGLALAGQLKSSQLKVALIDSKGIELDWSQGYDLRVSAITRASENLFKQVGAWPLIEANQKSPYQKMSVWDGESSQGSIEFKATSIGEDNLGHIIENRVLRKALYQSGQSASNIDYYFERQCQSVDYQAEHAELLLADGERLTAKLLVAADGAFSWLRQNSGIEVREKPYGHKALVATIKTEQSHEATAFQRFDQHGPLAFLPLPDPNYCSIVWSTKESFADYLLQLEPEDFEQQLQQDFEQRLGTVTLASQRLAFPLIERTVATSIQPRLALIGDAAHTIHPLAGQGVNLGFADAKVLAETILKAAAKTKDIGSLACLRPYQRQRQGDIWLMQQAMQSFKSLFEQTHPAVQTARAWGMKLLDKQPALKQQVIKKALGF